MSALPLKPKKPWALLAYTVAEDHSESDAVLDPHVKDELIKICTGVDFGRLSIAAQVDFQNTPGIYRVSVTSFARPRGFEPMDPSQRPLWRHVQKELAQPTTAPGASSSATAVRRPQMTLLRERVDTNAADVRVVGDFLDFGTRACPAERYVLFMYGHAAGPMGLFYDRDSWRDSAITLRINHLADALRAASSRGTIVIFRDCFMNTLETAYQFRGAAAFLIASQSVMPIAGVWPWPDLMASMKKAASTAAVAESLAARLGTFLEDGANRTPFADVPLSLIDVDASEAAVTPLKALVQALEAVRGDRVRCAACASALEAARGGYPNEPDRPGDPALLDVLSMCENLQNAGVADVARPARALAAAVRRIVRDHHTQGTRYRGISLYYQPVTRRDMNHSFMQPTQKSERVKEGKFYSEFALSMATGWDRIALNPLVAGVAER